MNTKKIELTKGGKSRFVNELEYSLIKDDMNGWTVKKAAPEVPKEVAERVSNVNVAVGGAAPVIATAGLHQPVITAKEPASILTTSPAQKPAKSRKK